MNLDFDPAVAQFRTEVASWLAEHVPDPPLPSVDAWGSQAQHRSRVLAAVTGDGG